MLSTSSSNDPFITLPLDLVENKIEPWRVNIFKTSPS